MTLRTLLALLPLTLVLWSCTESDKDEDEDEGSTDLPAEGEWTAGELTVVSDTCGFGTPGDDTGESGDDTTTITVTGDDSFTVVGDDISLTCDRDGSDFDCGSTSETQDFTSDGVDATVTQTLSYSVSLDSSESGAISISFSMTCEGSQCDAVAAEAEIPFPCESVLSAAISYTG
jgi:hypothetical protein